MKRYFFITLAVILLCGLIFSACTNTSTTTVVSTATTTATATATSIATASTTPTTTKTTTTPTTTGPQRGGILKAITPTGPVNLGYPFEETGFQDGIFMAPCLEGLVGFDGDTNIIPKLATKWEVASDYSAITFTLRKGVKFHDGTPFNAEAAKFNLDLYLKLTNYPTWRLMTSIDAVNDDTLRINLSKYDPTFIIAGPCQAGMVSPTTVQTLGKEACKTNPVGTGPFKFVNFERDVSLKFTRFDDYWDPGKPYLDGIEWSIIADPVTSLLAFKNGDGQVIRQLAANDAADLKKTGKYNFNVMVSAVQGMVPDSGNADSPFGDIRVRQAVAYAIDLDAISKATAYGFSKTTNQIVTREYKLYNTDVVGYPYNPDKARELLKEANYDNSLECTMTYLAEPGADEIWASVQSYLSDVGIKLKLDGAQMGKLFQTVTTPWHNGMMWTGCPSTPDMDLITQSFKNLFSTSSGWYPNMLHPDDYQALLDKAIEEIDTTKRNQMAQELIKMIIDKYCLVIPVFTNLTLTGIYPEVHDLDLQKGSISLWNPGNAWLSK
jgi:peptide/nickel transport system substrate-binding protein